MNSLRSTAMTAFKRQHMTILIAAALLFATPSLSQAEGILDQQLGPTAPPEKKEAPPAAATTDDNKPVAPTPPSAPTIDPKAAKALDDNDLVNKLTNSGAADKGHADADDALSQMVDRMGQSQSRLSDKDVGALTQETQRRIITNLDSLIELARKQQQQGKSQSKSQPKPGEQKQMSQGQKQSGPQQPGSTAAQTSQLTAGPIDKPQSNGEDLRNKGPSEWGGLPPKDRDMISNGVNEQYLPAYRDMIDRYYQALAEIGKSKER